MIGLVCYSPASINIMQSLYKKKELFHNNIVLFLLSDFSKSNHFGHSNLLSNSLSSNFVTTESTTIIKDIFFDEINEENLKNIITIIYNTGSGSPNELLIPMIIKNINPKINVIAINDIFWNTINDLEKRYEVMPDKIIVSTEECKKKLLKVKSINEDNILVIGNPYFDRLNDLTIIEDRSNLSVSFVSQCGLGGTYNEDTSEECKNAFYELRDLLNEGIISELYVYKHPRETGQFYKNNNFNVERDNNFLDMMRSDIIVSCGSTPHYEAIMIGKKNLFAGKNPLKTRIVEKKWDNVDIKIDLESTEKLIDYINNISKN